MKRLLLVFGLLLMANTGLANTIIETTISGMVCPMCAHNIEKSFKPFIKDKTIEDFKVDLKSKIVTFKLSESKQLSDAQIQTGINDAGYIVKKIERK